MCEEGCHEHKPKEKFEIYASGNVAKRCLACQHPKCQNCGKQQPWTDAAVYEHHKIAPSDAVESLKLWFCKKPACKKAALNARKDASSK
jgi:hypothetical protein